MAREKWNILSNMFEVKTRGSFKKANAFGQYHFAVLKSHSSEPLIQPMYNSFGPVFIDFQNAYTRWHMSEGLLKASVLGLNQALLSVNQKLKDWEPQVYVVYRQGTPEADGIFPNKRTPFYKGSDILRLEAVGTLAKALESYPALAAVHADVLSFYHLLKSKVDARHGAEAQIRTYSETLEQKRQKLCAEMYGNLGMLMYIYRHQIKNVEHYFDMGVIKNKVRRKKRGEGED